MSIFKNELTLHFFLLLFLLVTCCDGFALKMYIFRCMCYGNLGELLIIKKITAVRIYLGIYLSHILLHAGRC